MTYGTKESQPTGMLTTTTQVSPKPAPRKHRPITIPSGTISQPVVSGPNQVALAVRHDLHTCQGGRAKNTYYRYQVWRGRTVLHSKHIPCGNVDKPIAIARAAQVRGWIRNGVEPHKILRKLEQWKRDDTAAQTSQLPLF
jgi:hypothetical protein